MHSIFVKTLANKTITLMIQEDDTIEHVMLQIQAKMGISAAATAQLQLLPYCGGGTLAEHNIGPHACLYVVVRLRGGGCNHENWWQNTDKVGRAVGKFVGLPEIGSGIAKVGRGLDSHFCDMCGSSPLTNWHECRTCVTMERCFDLCVDCYGDGAGKGVKAHRKMNQDHGAWKEQKEWGCVIA